MTLELTKGFLSKKQMAQYEELVKLADPEDNHRRYRSALEEVIDPAYADFCIPWIGELPSIYFFKPLRLTADLLHFRLCLFRHVLGLPWLVPTVCWFSFPAVHLKELHLVLRANRQAIVIKNKPFINLERYILFMRKLKEVLGYPPPDLERFREQGELAYLEDQLRLVREQGDELEEVDRQSRTLRASDVELEKTKAARVMGLEMNVPKAAKVHVTDQK